MISMQCLTPVQKDRDCSGVFSDNKIQTYDQCQVSAPGAEVLKCFAGGSAQVNP